MEKKTVLDTDLVESLPHAVIVLEGERVVYANPAAYELLMPPFRLEGMGVRDVLPVELCDRVARGSWGGKLLNLEVDVVLRGEERRWVVDLFPVYAGEAEYRGLIIRDETQIRLLREKEEKERLSVACEELVRMIFSKIQPLAVGIVGICNYLEERGVAPEEISLMKKEALRLNRIVEEAMEFALSGGAVGRRVSLYKVIEDAIGFVMPKMAEKGIGVERDYLPGIPEVVGDPLELFKAFVEILRNAVESSPEGGTVRVVVDVDMNRRLCPGKGMVKVEIADKGVEIPEGMRDKMLLPFATTKNGHLGLGLARAYKVVREHGGDLEYRREGDGNIFCVYLPL